MAAFVIVLGALLAVTVIVAVVYALGIRSGSPAVRDTARRFHHAIGNPLQMRRAGAAGAFASVLRHRGRTTGTTYETPVWAARTEDGFAIAIVYGAPTDWLRNVLASGTAEIVHRGETYRVFRPEIVPMEHARSYFPKELQRIHRRLAVDRCLRVRLVDATASTAVVKGAHDDVPA